VAEHYTLRLTRRAALAANRLDVVRDDRTALGESNVENDPVASRATALSLILAGSVLLVEHLGL